MYIYIYAFGHSAIWLFSQCQPQHSSMEGLSGKRGGECLSHSSRDSQLSFSWIVLIFLFECWNITFRLMFIVIVGWRTLWLAGSSHICLPPLKYFSSQNPTGDVVRQIFILSSFSALAKLSSSWYVSLKFLLLILRFSNKLIHWEDRRRNKLT